MLVLTEYILPDLEETLKSLWVVTFNAWLNADDTRRWMYIFFWQKEDGIRCQSCPILCISSCTLQNELFPLKAVLFLLRPYIIRIFPALHNSFPQRWYVQRHSTSIPLVLGPFFAFLSALSFCGWHELKDCRSLDPFWCLCRTICLSEVPLLRPNPAFRCVCIFPLISMRLRVFWSCYLALNVLCLKEYRQIVAVWPFLITDVLVSSTVLATFSVVQWWSISQHKKGKKPRLDTLL